MVLEWFLSTGLVRSVMKGLLCIVTSVMTLVSPHFSNTATQPPAQPLRTVPVYDAATPLLTLAEHGATDYTIVYGAAAARAEKRAAQELKTYFDRIAGTDISLVTDDAAPAAQEIIVGKTNRAEDAMIDRAALGDDGYRIAAAGEKLIIAGGETRGTLYGVYSFLEDFFGCRWFAPEVELIPQAEIAAIPRATDRSSKPAFAFRATSWVNTWDAAWRSRQKLNGVVHAPKDETYTDILAYGGSDAGHTFRFFVPKEVYFESHPEYFALSEKGKRDPGQVCLSNEDVYALSLAHVLRWIAEQPDAAYISVSQNDNYEYCRCADCAAIDAAEGSQAGSLLRFVNRIARDVKAAGHDVLIHTFAYQYTRKPPKTLVPEDNVLVQLCSIECNHAAPYETTDPDFYRDLQGWAAICDRLIIWDYNTNFSHYASPFPDIGIMQKNVQMFHKNNAEGYYMQGNSCSVNGEFGELRAYLTAKLLWDPYCDAARVIEEFLCYYYGPGYKNLEDYMALLEENKGDAVKIFAAPEDNAALGWFDIERAQALWDACEAAAENEEQLARIQRSRLQLRYYMSVARKGEFFALNDYYDRCSAGEALYNDFKRFGIVQLREGKPIQDPPNFFNKASTWNVE